MKLEDINPQSEIEDFSPTNLTIDQQYDALRRKIDAYTARAYNWVYTRAYTLEKKMGAQSWIPISLQKTYVTVYRLTKGQIDKNRQKREWMLRDKLYVPDIEENKKLADTYIKKTAEAYQTFRILPVWKQDLTALRRKKEARERYYQKKAQNATKRNY